MTASELETRLAAGMVAAQAGDARAYAAFLGDCVPAIRAILRRQGVAAAQLDDIVQEVLLTIHRARATYDPARPFLPWLGAIASRRAVDALRRSGRAPREVADPVSFERQPDPAPSALDGAVAGERARDLRRAVESLPEAQREAVQRLGLAEETLDEAARATGRSKVALKVNFHRALKTLRLRLGGEGAPDA